MNRLDVPTRDPRPNFTTCATADCTANTAGWQGPKPGCGETGTPDNCLFQATCAMYVSGTPFVIACR